MARTFENQVALVTGGAGGLGRATCIALAEAGAHIVIADIDEPAGRELAAALDGDFVLCDVSRLDHSLAAVETALHLHNHLDVVGLTRALGPALAAEGVRFNAVCPSFAETNIIAGVRDQLEAQGVPLLAPETVAETVLEIFAGDGTGECWFVQYGRRPEPFAFRGIPGPRTAPV